MTAPDDAAATRLAGMRERTAGATPGPWVIEDTREQTYGGVDVRGRSGGGPTVARLIPLGYQQRNANAEFIAHARADLDDLLGAVEDVLGLCAGWIAAAPPEDDWADDIARTVYLDAQETAALAIRAAITKRLGGA